METPIIRRRMEYGEVSVVENASGQYGVLGSDGSEVVPFGRYAWISGFDGGLARVRTSGVRYKDPNVIAVFSEDLSTMMEGEKLVEYYEDLKTNHPEKLCRWGIINSEGEEVLEPVYDEVWNFFGKNRRSTRVEINGTYRDIHFRDLPGSVYYEPEEDFDEEYDYYYGTHYGEYAGSYAQDVMGYSDDVINDAFDGDPYACWNID